MSDYDCIIVGGGISGLSAAYALAKQGARVLLLEAAAQVGGVIRSERTADGFLIEHGPHTVTSADPALFAHFSELGIETERVRADRAAGKRYLVQRGELVELPLKPPAFLRSSLLSPTAKLRLLAELILPRSTAHDESVASFFARRLGVAPLEHLIDPFISGTYAGDPASLSIRATFPQLWEAEQRAGSMLRGMLRGRKRGTKRVPRELFNFQRGMASWPQAIADYIGPQRLWCNARVHTLRPTDGSWQIEVERAGQQRQLNAAQIILATPADVTANLIAALDGAAAKALRAISYPPIALVHLAYARVAVKHPVDGFGALCPAREGRKVLGTLWPSALFAGRAPRDTVLTSSFVGGARYPKLALQDDRALIAQVHAEQVALIGVSEAPLFSQIVRWQRSIPQYDAGHLERIAALAAAEQRYSGLYCIGNYRDGVSVERCWQHGVAIAAQMLKRYPVASLQ